MPVPCEFDTAVGGQYKVTAVVADTDGGRNRTELTTLGERRRQRSPPAASSSRRSPSCPTRPEYAPGDTAELLVQAPFAAGEGLLTISRNGIRDTVRFAVVDGSAVVRRADHGRRRAAARR